MPRYQLKFLKNLSRAICVLSLAWTFIANAAPVQLVEQLPIDVVVASPGLSLTDFGRVAFGNLELRPPPEASGKINIHFGEALAAGRIDRHPPGSVRYAAVEVSLAGTNTIVVAPPA